jgi:hypothetical protein
MSAESGRRRFLELVGGTAVLTLAGCTAVSRTDSDESASDSPAETDASTSTGTATATETETPTETPEPETSMSTVFHFAGATGDQKHAIANVTNLLNDSSTTVEDVVLVANGRGIKLLSSSLSEHADDVAELVERGVSFRACQNSMAAFDMDESDLVEGVETVPAGVGELTKLQAKENFAYIETP